MILLTFAVCYLHSPIGGQTIDYYRYSVFTVAILSFLIPVYSILGRAAGIAVFCVITVCFHFTFIRGYGQEEAMFLIAGIAVSFAGLRIWNDLDDLTQRLKIDTEKMEERINVLRDQAEQDTTDIDHFERRTERYLSLSRLTETFSSTLSSDELASAVVEGAREFLGKGDRILLYLVDAQDQELRLVFSKKTGDVPAIRHKKGDMFDRWVLWKKQCLLVDDIKKDFRFSVDDDKAEKVFNSLIACPLLCGDKVRGILRIDSLGAGAFTPEEMRLLDIIADLAAVAFENSMLYKKLSDMAITDGLTLLYVNKFFKEMLSNEITRSLKSGAPFSLVMFDIDGFKAYNDKYGHIAGDIVLKHIAGILSKDLAGGDMAARYGGEEFAVILPGKEKEEALKFAEALRKHIAGTPVILRREKTFVTISAGIAFFPGDAAVVDDLVRAADKRLYKAKEKGKNRTCYS